MRGLRNNKKAKPTALIDLAFLGLIVELFTVVNCISSLGLNTNKYVQLNKRSFQAMLKESSACHLSGYRAVYSLFDLTVHNAVYISADFAFNRSFYISVDISVDIPFNYSENISVYIAVNRTFDYRLLSYLSVYDTSDIASDGSVDVSEHSLHNIYVSSDISVEVPVQKSLIISVYSSVEIPQNIAMSVSFYNAV